MSAASAAAFRSIAKQNAKQEKNHICGDDDDGIISGIDFHIIGPSPSWAEGKAVKENEPNQTSAIKACLNLGKSKTKKRPMIIGNPYE